MKASWWTAIQSMIGLPIAVGVNLVVTRELGPSEFGIVASYMTVYGIIITVLTGGVHDATLQWGAAAYARNDRAELELLARRCAGWHMLASPIAGLAAIILLHRESALTQAVGAFSMTFTMFFGATVITMTAVSLNTVLAKISLVLGMATQLAVITAAIQSHGAGPTWVARIAVGVAAPAMVIALAPPWIRRAAIRPLLPRHWPAGFAKYAARTFVAGLVASLVFSRCEILVLDAYGDTTSAGLYALAAGLAVQLTSPIDAMLGPLLPAAASLTAVGRERIAAAINRGMRLGGVITAPLAMIGIPLVTILVPVIYASRFASTGDLFVALAVMSCLQSVFHPVTAFVSALRKPVLVLAINGAALAVDLALVVALIPSIGAAGAVVANTAGQVISLALSVRLLRNEVGYGVQSSFAALLPFALVATGATLGTVLGLGLVNHGQPVWLGCLSAVVASSILGIGAVRVCGGMITEDDLRTVEQALPRVASLARKALPALGFVAKPEAGETPVESGPEVTPPARVAPPNEGDAGE